MIKKTDFLTLSIRKRIFFSFSSIIILYAAIALVNYSQINQVKELSEEVVPYSLQMDSLHKFAVSLESLEKHIDNFFLVGYAEYKERSNEDLERMFDTLDVLKGNSKGDSIPRLKELENLISELKTNIHFLTDLEKNPANSREVNEMIILVYEQIDTAREKYRELLSETTNQVSANVIEQKSLILTVVNQFVMLGASILVIGILMSLFLSLSISKPITKLKDVAIKIGKGNLDTKIDIKSRDEIGELASAFGQMTQDLKKSQEQIKRHAQELEQKVQERTKELDKRVGELTGTKTAVLNMMEDMDGTNRKLIETQGELEKSLKDLKELDIKKDQFISIAAHELKTPLTSIHGFSQLLQNRKIANNFTKRNKYLKIMDHETKRLAKLVTDILDLSRIDLGTIKFSLDEVDIKQLIMDIEREMKIVIKQKGLGSEFEIEKGVPRIITDRERLTEILINLINNAAKYTPKGKITVRVFKEGECLHFVVKDTGIGISEEYKEKIFERFYQIDSSYSRKAGGTGLGLALCKEFVGFLGGRIWIESKIGKGSEFHFSLPVKGPTKQQMRNEEREAEEALKKSKEVRKEVKKME